MQTPGSKQPRQELYLTHASLKHPNGIWKKLRLFGKWKKIKEKLMTESEVPSSHLHRPFLNTQDTGISRVQNTIKTLKCDYIGKVINITK